MVKLKKVQRWQLALGAVTSLEFTDGRCLLWVLLLELVKAVAVSWEDSTFAREVLRTGPNTKVSVNVAAFTVINHILFSILSPFLLHQLQLGNVPSSQS